MLTNVRVILVETSHPGNIGAVARAMKTMCLTDLRLVSPKCFPHEQATAMSSGAEDLLLAARCHNTLEQALVDCTLVMGATARSRSLAWSTVAPHDAAIKAVTEAARSPVALVFGRESSGLTNDELAICHAAVHIPTNPAFSSLNVAAAVQVLAYEVYVAHSLLDPAVDAADPSGEVWVSAQAMEGFYEHMSRALAHVGFFDVGNPTIVMRRLRRLFARSRLDENEYNILRGFFRAVLQRHGGRGG
jgi:TrmH family RNA methyltransferase